MPRTMKKTPATLAQEARKYNSAEEFVKAQGRPLYHGTAADFEEFDTTRAGTLKSSDWGRKGIYFDPTRWGADYYREGAVKSTDKKANRLYKEMEEKAAELGTTLMMAAMDLGYDSKKYNELREYEIRWRKRLKELDEDTAKGRIIEAYIAPNAKKHKHIYEPGMITDSFLADTKKEEGYDAVEIWDRDPDTNEKWLTEVIVMNPKVIRTKPQLVCIWNKERKKLSYQCKTKCNRKHDSRNEIESCYIKCLEGDT